MAKIHPQYFTIDVDGKPIVVFQAVSWHEAQEQTRERWFLDDLQVMTSTGLPVCSASAILAVRLANAIEAESYGARPDQNDKTDDLALVYLVPFDRKGQHLP